MPAAATQRIMLAWDPSPDETVIGYRLYRGIGEFPVFDSIDIGNTNLCELDDLSEGQIYQFFVTAYDANGIESEPSNTLEFRVPFPITIAWPTASAIAYGQALAHSVLSGGSASVPGSFAFTAPGTAPVAGTTEQSVTFTPADAVNFSPVNGTVSVTVLINAAASVVLENLSHIYDGMSKAAAAITEPVGLTVELTYNGSPTPPTTAGNYLVVGTVNDGNYTGSTTNTLIISKAAATVSLEGLAQTFDGAAKAATATTDPAGLTVALTYDGTTSPPTAAGSYLVVCTVNDVNYTGSAISRLVVSTGAANVMLDNLSHTYDGTAKAVTVNTEPTGLTVDFTYDGQATAPTAAGSYVVVGTVNDANYKGSATSMLVIGKAAAIVMLDELIYTYDGTSKSANAITDPAGLKVELIYDGSPDLPTAAGAYRVVGAVADTNFAGSSTNMLLISKAAATVRLEDLIQSFDGTPKAATATTDPAGLTVELTYDDSPSLPTEPGSYLVVGTVNDDNYTGSATNTLVIVRAALITLGSLSQTYDGSAKTATATADPGDLTVELTYDGSPVAPTEAGGYTVVASVNDGTFIGSATNTLVISKALAQMVLDGLSQTYDGQPKIITGTTDPHGLAVDFTYDGNATAPVAAGSYTVVGTVNDANYYGLFSGTLEITRASSVTRILSVSNPPAGGSNLTFSAAVGPVASATTTLTGSVQFLTNGVSAGEPVPLADGAAMIGVDFLPPGTNTVTANYLGDANHFGSSSSLSQVIVGVAEAPTVMHITRPGNGSVAVTFAGTPGAEYLVLCTTNTASGSWETVSTNAAGPAGQWTYTDNTFSSHPQRFFRAAKP